MLEARAALRGVMHACRSPALRDKRVLFTSDNLAAVCAYAKGRARHFGLLRLCRRAAALTLAAGILPRWRYVESKRNCADAATRPWLLGGAAAATPPAVGLAHSVQGVRDQLRPPVRHEGLPRKRADGGHF